MVNNRSMLSPNGSAAKWFEVKIEVTGSYEFQVLGELNKEMDGLTLLSCIER
jgi:hypothetical protein